ncbi:hypothetical protein EV121DRAFT_296673 [Schizophyllum commune]
MSRHLRSSAAEEQQDASTASSFEDATQEHSRCIRPNKRKIEDSDNDADLTIIEQDATGPPNKRNRTEYTKHEHFWFLDGNILLQLGDTRFQLYRGRLASQSPWLKALFEQHAGGEPEVNEDAPALETVTVKEEDGGEVLYLDGTGVDLGDFVQLLAAMEDAIDFCADEPSFLQVIAIFRAASILRFTKFEAYAKKHITKYFPDELKAVKDIVKSYAAEVVALAREWFLPTVLRRAFYELARDPDTETSAVEDESYIDILSPFDLRLLVRIQKNLTDAWVDATSLDRKKYECKEKDCTSDHPYVHWRAIHSSGLCRHYMHDPIKGMQALMDWSWTKAGYCAACATRRRTELKEKRAKLWADLGEWCRVDGKRDGDSQKRIQI